MTSAPELAPDPRVERLRALLVADDVGRLEDRVEQLSGELAADVGRLGDEVGGLRGLLGDSDRLIELLTPVILELLGRQIAESQEMVSRTLAPIMDASIRQRVESDREAMTQAIAPVVGDAILDQVRSARAKVVEAIQLVIAEVISREVQRSRAEVAEALSPVIGPAIKDTVRDSQDEMVDALYPVIGNTIARYMTETLKQLVERINEQVQNTMSVDGIKRKLYARMRGISEAELIIRDALGCRVRAAFLIHKASGLPIAEALGEDGEDLDPEMIAGMLTAIREFVADWIARAGSTTELHEIDYGGSKLLIEVAGFGYLALLVEGVPSAHFADKPRAALAQLVLDHSETLEAFDGDPDDVPAEVGEALHGLLGVELPAPREKKPTSLWPFAISMTIVTSLLCWWIAGVVQARWSRAAAVAAVERAIADSPELAVYRVSVASDGERLRLRGAVPSARLAAEAARLAAEAAPQRELDNQLRVAWIAPPPEARANAARSALRLVDALPGVTAEGDVVDGQLVATLTVASPDQAAAARALLEEAAAGLSGSRLTIRQAAAAALSLPFDAGRSELTAEAARALVELAGRLAEDQGLLIVLGGEDRALATRRGQAIRAQLEQAALADARIELTFSARAGAPAATLLVTRAGSGSD